MLRGVTYQRRVERLRKQFYRKRRTQQEAAAAIGKSRALVSMVLRQKLRSEPCVSSLEAWLAGQSG